MVCRLIINALTALFLCKAQIPFSPPPFSAHCYILLRVANCRAIFVCIIRSILMAFQRNPTSYMSPIQAKMIRYREYSCLVVGNYCHDVLMKDDVVLAESLGGAASFISAVLDGVSVSSLFISKVGSDFSYSVTHPPHVSPSSKTTLFHAHFSSQIHRQDRVLKRVHACDWITPADIPQWRRFEFGLAVGVAGEILPETLEKMLDKCDMVLVDVQALIRVFDPEDGTVKLVHLRDSGFYHLLPRIRFLKASSDEAPYIDVEEARKVCCVVLTNGKDGCTVYYRNLVQQIAPFPTVQLDPTGAGDSFLGGLVVGLAHGLTVPDAALLGNFFGSLTVGQIGLPKFDLSLLQAVKDEVDKRGRVFFCGRLLDNVIYTKPLEFRKPLDHEEFRSALVRAKTSMAVPIQECQQEVSRPVHNLTCNGNSCEEPIKLEDRIP